MKTFEISDTRKPGVLIKLSAVLGALPPTASSLSWRCLDLEGYGDISDTWQEGALELERRVQQAVGGLDLPWETIVDIADRLEIINCKFEGSSNGTEVFVEGIDSSVWVVSGDLPNLEQHITDRFSMVRRVG